MLKTQPVDLKFLGGADSKTDDPNTIYTSFREMQNTRVDQIGAVYPRGGFTIKPFTSPTSQAFDVTTSPGHTVFGGSNVLSAVNAAGVSSDVLTPALRGTLERLYAGDCVPGTLSAAVLNGRICMLWVVPTSPGSLSGGAVGSLVVDAATGRVDQQTTTQVGVQLTALKVVTWGTVFVAIAATAAFNLIQFAVDPDSLRTAISGGSLALPGGTTAARFAVCAVPGALFVAYAMDNATSVSLKVFTGTIFSNTPTTTANLLTFTGAAKCLAIHNTLIATTAIAVFAGCDGVEAKGGLYNGIGTAVGSPISAATSATFVFQRIGTDGSGTTFGRAYFSGKDTATANVVFGSIAVSTTGGNGSSGSPYPAVYLTGITVIDTLTYGIAETFSPATYGSQAIVRPGGTPTFRLGAFGASANLGQNTDREMSQLPDPVQFGTKTFFPLPMATAVTAISAVPTGSATFQTVGITPKLQATLLVHDTSAHPVTMIDTTNRQNLYLGASQSQLTAYDRGAGVWPELALQAADFTTVTPGAFARAIGVVSYVFAKLWKSADGLEYRTYSPIYTAETGLNQTLQTRVNTMNFLGGFNMTNEVVIEQYRTEVNQTIFYLANTFLSASTYIDTSIDGATGILKGRLADINSGELAPELPQSSRLVTTYKDRIAMVSPDKPTTVLFNRPAPFPVGTSFASGLEVDVGAVGGSLTGMIQMDSALYLLKSNSVYTMYGDPPGATGEGGTLTVPQIVFNGTGCVSPRSVLLTPKGIVFKSGKGFYLVERNQQLQFIGAGPYEDNAFAVVGAAIAETQYEVMFAFSNGSVWVYNMDTSAWYEWVPPLTPRAITAAAGAVTMAVDTGVMAYSTTTTIDQVTTGTTALIGQDITTGWFRFESIRGFQRIKRISLLGTKLANCQVTIDVLLDYSDTPVQTFTSALTGTGLLQIDLHLAVQKGEAMSFRIRTDKYGIKLSGATLEIGKKSDTDKSRSSGSNISG